MVSGYLLLAMKNRGCHIVLYFLVSLYTSLVFLLAVPLSHISGHAQDTSDLEVLWCLGDCNSLAMEFDECPGREEVYYTILDKTPDNVKGFPEGIVADSSSDEANCLPSKISLYFSLKKNYAHLILSMALNGWGEFFIYCDSLPIHKIMFYTPYGWQKEKIPWPYLSSGEHTLVLEAIGNDSYVYFDYIKLEGFRDTDQDGIIDQEEGDLDSDGDGLPDWQDADCVTKPIPLSFPYEGTLLLTIKNRETCQASQCLFVEAVTFYDIYSLHDPNQDLPNAPAGQIFSYGIISVSLKDLPEGEAVMLSLIPPRPFHGVEKVWAKNYDHGWRSVSYNLIDNQMDFIITDGDVSDKDGETNGKIAIFFALTIPVQLSPYSNGSCFINTLNRSGNLYR